MAKNRTPSFMVDLSIDGYIVEGDITEMCRIDTDTILDEITEQPARYAYVASVLAYTQRKIALLKQTRDSTAARLKKEITGDNSAAGIKTTEAGLDRAIRERREYENILEMITYTEGIALQLNAICAALAARKDMLVIASHTLNRAGYAENIVPTNDTFETFSEEQNTEKINTKITPAKIRRRETKNGY